MELTTLDAGMRVAGAMHVALLGCYAAAMLRPVRFALVPVFYCASLVAALLRPLADAGAVDGVETAIWSLSSALPAATYLLVVQLADRVLPARRHAYVLAIPALAIPLIHLGSFLGEAAAICVAAADGPCLAIAPGVMVYEVVTGAAVLLLLMWSRGARIAAMRQASDSRVRAFLILAIVALQGLMLALSLAALSGLVTAPRAGLAAAVLQVTMIYLLGSALFRLPPEQATARTPAAAARQAAGAVDRAARALDHAEAALLARIQELMTLDKLYQEPGFSRRQLAEELGVPEHRVTRAINDGLGQSFTEMVNAHRVAEAANLLAQDDLSVTEIAFAVGFNSLATFNRVFKQKTGMNPSAYRRRETGTAEAPATVS